MIGTIGAYLVVLSVAVLGVLLGVAATALSRPRGGAAAGPTDAPPIPRAVAPTPRLRIAVLVIAVPTPFVLAWAAVSTDQRVNGPALLTMATCLTLIGVAVAQILRRHT